MSNWFGVQQEAAGPRRTRRRTPEEIDDLERHFRNLSIRDGATSAIRSSYPNDLVSQLQYGGGTKVYSTASKNKPTKRQPIQSPLKKIIPVTPGNTSFMMDNISDWANTFHWDNISYNGWPAHFVPVSVYTAEYQHIEQLFTTTNKKCFQITDIQRIQNPYLLSAFLLKREQMIMRIGNVDIEELFHGTKAVCVDSICNDNFDWRRYGQNIGNKFGQGISFSPTSSYATHYSDDVMNGRIMLLAYVLVGNEVIGARDMVLPPQGWDTSIEPHRKVIVKYEDNEFYPAYKIKYKCTSSQELHQRRVRNTRYQKRQTRRANMQDSFVCYGYEDYYDHYF